MFSNGRQQSSLSIDDDLYQNIHLNRSTKPIYSIDLTDPVAEVCMIDSNLVNRLQNVNRIGTYNWPPLQRVLTTNRLPIGTMIVPGMPKVYNNYANFEKLMRDNLFSTDSNQFHSSRYPCEPTIRAIQQQNDFDFQQFDIVTNSITIETIFNFCITNGLNRTNRGCRFDVQRIGRLLVIDRSIGVNDADTMHDGRIFQRNFIEQMTKPLDALTIGSFHQIVGYQFGRLKIIVDTNVAAVAPPQSTDDSMSDLSVNDFASSQSTSFDATEHNGRLSINKFADDSELRYVSYGETMPFQSIDMTTRVVGAKISWHTIWARIFFGCFDHLRLGRVEAISGQLCRVRVMTEKEVREEAFTNVNQLNNMTMALRKTESILRAICESIRTTPDQQSAAIVIEQAKLTIYECNNAPLLPDSCVSILMRR